MNEFSFSTFFGSLIPGFIFFWIPFYFTIGIILGVSLDLELNQLYEITNIVSMLASFVFSVFLGIRSSDKELVKEQLEKEKIRKKALSRVEKVIIKHADSLLRKRKQLLVKNDYGKYEDLGWEKEVNYFFNEVLDITEEEHEATNYSDDIIALFDNEINLAKDNKNKTRPSLTEVNNETDGIDFEHICTDILSSVGWDSKVSKASGDNGVDIVAKKNIFIVAIQCKRYSGKVGVAAVREIHAGKTLVGATHAAVVTNSQYTPQAKKEAAGLEVKLLHHSQLETLDSYL